MHVLVIPSWYQSSFNRLSGVFFKDQAVALSEKVEKVGVIAPVLISLKDIIKTKSTSFYEECNQDGNLYEQVRPILAFPFWKRLNRMVQFYIGKKMLNQYVQKFGIPDVVHLQSTLAGELALWMQNRYKVPFIVSEHWSAFLQNRATKSEIELAHKVFDKSKCNIAVSSYFASQLKKQFQKEFKVIANSVDISFFKTIKSSYKQTTFLQVAHLDDNKNQEMLVKAFSHLSQQENITLTIVGGGRKKNHKKLKNLIKSLNLAEKIRLYGVANREKVRELMQQSHCLVISSYVETFGVVAIEAMACGIPVVSTKCGGPEDIINTKTGLLCEINEEAICEAMQEALTRNWDSSYIRHYAESNFSKASFVENILSTIY